MTSRFDGDIPGWGGLARNDRLYVGDFDGDHKADLYIFNGLDWSMSYLGMFQSTGTSLVLANRFDGDVPGWGGLAANDQFLPADFTGDGKTDLFVYNTQDWVTEYVGRMSSTGNALTADFVGDWIGEWNLGGSDRYEVCNFEGTSGQPNLFIHNQDWFGMIHGRRSLSLQQIYSRWIHNYRYGRHW
jgi:hypothetical protein